MINKLNLTLDHRQMYIALIMELENSVNMLSNVLLQRFQAASGNSTIADDWKIVYDRGMSILRVYVGNDHWQAFIDNYGKGSLMDTSSNPWLSEYINSGYFNEQRIEYGYAIITRPRGEYTVPNFQSGKGTIKRVSKARSIKNLETTGNPLYRPLPAKHWLENEMIKFEPLFYQFLQDTVRHFPFSNYLRGG